MIDQTILNPSTWTTEFVNSWTNIITQANFGTAPDNLSEALTVAQSALSSMTDADGPQVITLNNDGTATVTGV